MQWTNPAILLSAKPYGENSAIVQLLTQTHGRHAGLVRGIQGKKNRGTFEQGNILEAHWQGRLQEHLGHFSAELTTQTSATFLHDNARLSCLCSALSIIETSLPEREPHPTLYAALEAFLHRLRQNDNWETSYVRLELLLLTELGFGLDLSSCAATGTTQDLLYVSPKSGRAVSRLAGEPYKDKLLPLPAFLREENTASNPSEIVKGLALCGYFLDKCSFQPHHRTLPAARGRWVEMVIA